MDAHPDIRRAWLLFPTSCIIKKFPHKSGEMRKLIVSMNLSLDGYLSGACGELDWHFEIWNDQMGDKILERLEETDTIILGRVTYEVMAKYWTVKPLEDHFPRQDLAIADKMNHHTKVVFSKTLKKSIWHGSVFATGDPKEEIKKLKKQEGKDMIAIWQRAVLLQCLSFRVWWMNTISGYIRLF